MGGFYGGIHIRTPDRERVLAVLRTMPETRFLVGPAFKGWVGVYPEHGGQDEKVSAALARHLAEDILHLLVHDDDIFVYFYYRNHELVDQFDSNPDYFGPAPDKDRWRGHPQRLEHLLKPGKTVADLTRALRAPAAMRYQTLARVSKLFDIPNAVTSFEYLENEEVDGIRYWKKFVRLPPATEPPSGAGLPPPLAAVDMKMGASLAAAQDGFWLAGAGQVQHWASPWIIASTEGPRTFNFRVVEGTRYRAVVGSALELFERQTRVAEKPGVCVPWAFTPEDGALLVGDHEGLWLLAVPSLQTLKHLRLERYDKAILHPPWVVAMRNDRIFLWHLPSNEVKVLLAGGRRELHPISEAMAQAVHAQLGKLTEHDVLQALKGTKMPKGFLDLVKSQIAEMKAQATHPLDLEQGNELWFDIATTTEYFFAAGRERVSAWRWDDLVAASGSTPPPLWSVDAVYAYGLQVSDRLYFVTHPGMPHDHPQGTLVAVEPATGQILGQVQLTVQEVLKSPTLSRDGRYLACLRTNLKKSHRPTTAAVYDLEAMPWKQP